MAGKGRQRAVRGAGSIRQDERGYWVAQIPAPPGPDGKRRRITVRARTRPEMLRRLETARRGGAGTVDERTTLGEWLALWQSEILPGTVKEATAKTYGDYCRLWIGPHIGAVALGELGPEHITRMLNELEAAGIGAGTRRQVRTILSSALTRAERWGKLPGGNPTRLTDRPRKSQVRDEMTADEAKAILEAAGGDRHEALAYLLLFLGLRPGEALALRWEHVDLDGPEPRLDVVASKSDAGIRTLPLPGAVVAVLRAHRAGQAAERLASEYWHDPGVVFTNDVGVAVVYRRFHDWWRRLIARSGLAYRRPYSARHTAATLMLNAGVPLAVVSKILGHANLSITADVYANVGDRLKADALGVLDTVLA